ncbi:MAG: hypothetical protein U0531_19480 [Dehalococcoidia bacterium]
MELVQWAGPARRRLLLALLLALATATAALANPFVVARSAVTARRVTCWRRTRRPRRSTSIVFPI